MALDYSSILKTLEAGVAVPTTAFSKSVLGLSKENGSSDGISKCSKCGEPRTSIGWCKPCNTKKLKDQFQNWTSGDDDLDEFIRETQTSANTPFDYMRWIPFDSFSDLEFIAKGGFGAVYSAKSKSWGQVALKFLDNSQELTRDFLEELRAHHRCSLGSGIIDCYGVSKDPEKNQYVMVMRYADHGSLRRYLSQYFTELSWEEKILLFDKICKGLKGIHDAGLVHPPFQGPKTKKVKTGHLVKSAINKTNSVHPQAFYTSRLLHYPNLPEPRNCETFTLFDPTTGEIHSMVRKSTKNRETTDEQKSNKGKERSREDFQTHHGRKDSMTRSMTMGKLDREMLDKIKNDRSSRRMSQIRWSTIVNDIPKQVELSTLDEPQKET
ncbi:326_t:CDS:2 [Entrophospora sp. SA101]|nr:650_t:CDS:2 [Entrophospora sp. SA101]CAJ0626594.1 326_t:CDS:2 [Entrophospora sp. SA101]